MELKNYLYRWTMAGQGAVCVCVCVCVWLCMCCHTDFFAKKKQPAHIMSLRFFSQTDSLQWKHPASFHVPDGFISTVFSRAIIIGFSTWPVSVACCLSRRKQWLWKLIHLISTVICNGPQQDLLTCATSTPNPVTFSCFIIQSNPAISSTEKKSKVHIQQHRQQNSTTMTSGKKFYIYSNSFLTNSFSSASSMVTRFAFSLSQSAWLSHCGTLLLLRL